MSASKLFLLFITFVASVGALSTPHARGIHHRALAGRIAVPESLDVPPVVVRKRQNSKRCKPRSSSAALAVSAKETTSTKEAAPTKEPATTKEPVTTQEPAPTKEPATTKEAPTTKETQAPPPTTHKASPTPKPSPSPTKEAPPPPATTKKPAPPPAPASDLPSYLTGTHSGDATFYATGLGACGITNSDSDFIAAASMKLFDGFLGYNGGDPNSNPICGRKVAATYQGKTVQITITDRCVGCDTYDLDFSPHAFDQLASESLGRLHGMTWHFI